MTYSLSTLLLQYEPIANSIPLLFNYDSMQQFTAVPVLESTQFDAIEGESEANQFTSYVTPATAIALTLLLDDNIKYVSDAKLENNTDAKSKNLTPTFQSLRYQQDAQLKAEQRTLKFKSVKPRHSSKISTMSSKPSIHKW